MFLTHVIAVLRLGAFSTSLIWLVLLPVLTCCSAKCLLLRTCSVPHWRYWSTLSTDMSTVHDDGICHFLEVQFSLCSVYYQENGDVCRPHGPSVPVVANGEYGVTKCLPVYESVQRRESEVRWWRSSTRHRRKQSEVVGQGIYAISTYSSYQLRRRVDLQSLSAAQKMWTEDCSTVYIRYMLNCWKLFRCGVRGKRKTYLGKIKRRTKKCYA